ncbi:MAG: hypothetical protein N4A35_15210 [Flavobacteriales bacterium]|jgi:hypothetical protein|nr:hypothetical protein [Flavobacteriales bacterium]
MNLKESTRLAKVKLVEKQLKIKRYDNALEIICEYRLKNYTITKSRAKSEYNLTDKDFKALSYVAVDNPYYKSAPKMKLYSIQELKDKYSKAARRERKIDELLIVKTRKNENRKFK